MKLQTRIVFRIYSILAGLVGLLLFAGGPAWLGREHSFLIRVTGSILIAAGCFAVALAAVDDPRLRRWVLGWFAAGHGVVLFVVLIQWNMISAYRNALWAVEWLAAVTLLLFYLWNTSEGGRPVDDPPISLFGDSASPSTARLRTSYEQQIRQAASQEERNRLARDLHDSIKQQIFVIQTAAATVEARFAGDPTGARQALEQVRSSAREAMTEMEAMLDQLRAAPLENTGLIEALHKQCEALGFRSGAQVDFNVGKLPPSKSVAPGAHQAIFRVAQEALANIGRHARASRVLVSIGAVNSQIELKIQDDGAGFDPNQVSSGMGLANMRARAREFGGIFELQSRPGEGTSVKLAVPYTVPRPQKYRSRALVWALSGAVSALVLLALRWSISALELAAPWLLVSLVAFTRETVAYFRARKQVEAD